MKFYALYLKYLKVPVLGMSIFVHQHEIGNESAVCQTALGMSSLHMVKYSGMGHDLKHRQFASGIMWKKILFIVPDITKVLVKAFQYLIRNYRLEADMNIN